MAEDLVERVLERMSDAFVCLDRDGRCLFVNERAGAILGRQPGDLLGKRLWTELPGRADRPLRSASERAVAENRPAQLEEFDPATGRWLETHIDPGRDGVAILFIDVTARRATEDALRKDSAARAQAERMAHLGFWEWDVAANRVEWSEELYRIYGLARAEFGASFQGYLERVHPDDRARVRGEVEAALREKRSFTFEERIVRPDGSVRHLRSWGSVAAGPDGAARQMFGTCLDMTQLIETTEGLARSERGLELALEAGRVVLWDWSVRTGDVAWSPGADELLGTLRAAGGEARPTLLSLVHPDDRARVEPLVEKAIAGRTAFAVEFRARRTDGSVGWLSARGRVVPQAQEEVHVAGSLVDVTDRKRTELLLAGESTVLERISESAPLLESLELLARTMDAQAPGNLSSVVLLDAEGKRIGSTVGPSLPPAYSRALVGLAIGPSAGSCGTCAYRRERVFVQDIATDPLWAEYCHMALPHGLRACWSTPILDASGTVLGTFAIYRREPSLPGPHDLAIIARATNVARIAIESARAREALRRSNERFDLVIRSADAGIWDADFTTNDLFLSPRWKSQLGYADDELPNRSGLWESLLHPDDRERAQAAVREYLDGKATTFELEHRLRHKDGTYRWISARGIVVRDAEGKPLRMAGSHQDVTERRALQAQFLQAQKMETVGRLASGVAHDFRNVLMVISSCAELILAGLPAGDPLRDLAHEIQEAGRHAGSLTRQLLILARQEAPRPEILDLNAVVAGMETLLRRLIRGAPRLEIDLGRPLGLVEADPSRVEQVILNLCVNARDAMPDGGAIAISTGDADISTAVTGLRGRVEPGRWVRLAVRDEGSGMPPEVVSRLFEPFFTTKESGRGTGLGLSTVDAIVRAAGGSIVVESEAGRGSTFAVYFPRARPTP